MLNDDMVLFVSNRIVWLLVRRGVCEMHEWRAASCCSVGQLLTGNCILTQNALNQTPNLKHLTLQMTKYTYIYEQH